MGKVIWTFFKLLVLAIVVVYGIWFGARNMYILQAVLEFRAPVPLMEDPVISGVSLWAVFAGLFLLGLILGGFKGVACAFRQRREVKRATRTIADLEGEVVSYRGNAAREAERTRYGDDD